APVREQVGGKHQVVLAGGVQVDVDAVRCRPSQPVGEVGVAVVEGDLGAECPALVQVGGASAGDDPGAGAYRPHGGRPAHVARAAADVHRLARLQPGVGGERQVCGGARM